MLYFATLFDKNYLPKGLALHQSLRNYCAAGFELYVLALDEDTATYFETNAVPDVIVIRLNEIEQKYPVLKKIREDRSRIEFFFTISPFLPSFILEQFSRVDRITTLDSDIYFYSDPGVIFNTYPHASILITPHNFAPALKHLTKYGLFNVSFQSFKNNTEALSCLAFWREQCAEWCFDQLDEFNSRYADQKYLDLWPSKYPGLAVIELKGAGVAPWNLDKFHVTLKHGRLYIDNEPLIYYHYHHLRVFNKYFAINAFEEYSIRKISKGVKEIYHRYLRVLMSIQRNVSTNETTEIRYHHYNNTFYHNLKEIDGYFFFSDHFIYHLNPKKGFYSKLIKASSKIYGNITRLSHFYR